MHKLAVPIDTLVDRPLNAGARWYSNLTLKRDPRWHHYVEFEMRLLELQRDPQIASVMRRLGDRTIPCCPGWIHSQSYNIFTDRGRQRERCLALTSDGFRILCRDRVISWRICERGIMRTLERQLQSKTPYFGERQGPWGDYRRIQIFDGPNLFHIRSIMASISASGIRAIVLSEARKMKIL